MEQQLHRDKQGRPSGDPWWPRGYQSSAPAQNGRPPGGGNNNTGSYMQRPYGADGHGGAGNTEQYWILTCDPRDLDAMQHTKVSLKAADTINACRENPDGTHVLAQVPGSSWIPGRAFLSSRNIPLPYAAPPVAPDGMMWFSGDEGGGSTRGPDGDIGGPGMSIPGAGDGPRPGSWEGPRDLLRARPGPPGRMDSGRIGVRHPPAPIPRQDSGQGFGGLGPRTRPMFTTGWEAGPCFPPPNQSYDVGVPPGLQRHTGLPPQPPPGGPLPLGRSELHPEPWPTQDGGVGSHYSQQFAADSPRQNSGGLQPESARPQFQGAGQPGPHGENWTKPMLPTSGMASLPAQPSGPVPAPPAPLPNQSYQMYGRQPSKPLQPQQMPYAPPPGPEPHRGLLPHTQPPPPTGPPPPDYQQPVQPLALQAQDTTPSNLPPWVTSPWEAHTSLELDNELQSRITSLQGSWGILHETWSENWQETNRTAITLLLASSGKAWEDEGWKMQGFEWEAQYLDSRHDSSGQSDDNILHPQSISAEQAKRVLRERDPSASSVQIPVLQEHGELFERPQEGCWTLLEGRHLPQDPRRGGVHSSEPSTECFLAVPRFVFTVEEDPWNPACNLLPINTEQSRDAPCEMQSPGSSWSSHQRDEPVEELDNLKHRPVRPDVLQGPEYGVWTFYDGSGIECINKSMAEMRLQAKAGVLPFGASLYRKEDGIWLELQPEPCSSDIPCLGSFAGLSQDQYSVRAWFLNTHQLALRQISQPWDKLSNQDGVGQCAKAMEYAADSDSGCESGWFDSYSPENTASIKEHAAQTLVAEMAAHQPGAMAGTNVRDFLGVEPPPQFAATLRAEMHKKVVQGEAGKVMAGKLLQDVLGTMFKAFSANQVVSKLPDGAPTAVLRKEGHPASAASSRNPATPADSATVGVKRKAEPDGKAAPHDSERPTKPQTESKPQQGFFGPIEDSKIDKDRVKPPKDRSKASAQVSAKRSKDTPFIAKSDPVARKVDKLERAIKLVLDRLCKFDRKELESCFARPVLEVFPALKEDYLSVVKKPIALSDMVAKLQSHGYRNSRGWETFGEDVHRMIRNCQAYNKNRQRYQDFSQHMLQVFSDLCHENRKLLQ